MCIFARISNDLIFGENVFGAHCIRVITCVLFIRVPRLIKLTQTFLVLLPFTHISCAIYHCQSFSHVLVACMLTDCFRVLWCNLWCSRNLHCVFLYSEDGLLTSTGVENRVLTKPLIFDFNDLTVISPLVVISLSRSGVYLGSYWTFQNCYFCMLVFH